MSHHAFLFMGLAVTLVAALYDWRTGTIPDRLTLGALAAAPIVHAAFALQRQSAAAAASAVAFSVMGALAAGVLPFLMMRAGGMGGGDVKLFFALGAVTGPGFVVHAETYAFLVAAIHGLAVVARRKTIRTTFGNVVTLLTPSGKKLDRPGDVPRPSMTSLRFALSVFLGTCVASMVLWHQTG